MMQQVFPKHFYNSLLKYILSGCTERDGCTRSAALAAPSFSGVSCSSCDVFLLAGWVSVQSSLRFMPCYGSVCTLLKTKPVVHSNGTDTNP